jgi:hypothetical protein
MPKKASAKIDPVDAIRKLALSYPDTTEGVVCERSSFKAKGKSFLFMGVKDEHFDVMVKLEASLDEAAALSKKQPDHYSVGGHNWVTAKFGRNELPPSGLLERWIEESFRLLAPKGLVATLQPNNKTVPKKKR